MGYFVGNFHQIFILVWWNENAFLLTDQSLNKCQCMTHDFGEWWIMVVSWRSNCWENPKLDLIGVGVCRPTLWRIFSTFEFTLWTFISPALPETPEILPIVIVLKFKTQIPWSGCGFKLSTSSRTVGQLDIMSTPGSTPSAGTIAWNTCFHGHHLGMVHWQQGPALMSLFTLGLLPTPLLPINSSPICHSTLCLSLALNIFCFVLWLFLYMFSPFLDRDITYCIPSTLLSKVWS